MIPTVFSTEARGKLLLSGEYFVLDGAMALAVPTRRGQQFRVRGLAGEAGHILWTSFDDQGNAWFRGRFSGGNEFVTESSSDEETAALMIKLLRRAAELQPAIRESASVQIDTRLEFPRNWGLGSSSTLVYCLAEWLKINPYELLEGSFGGSGYDVACADTDRPVTYQLLEKRKRAIERIELKWPFKDRLHFVHLGRKQDSRKAVSRYRKRNPANKRKPIEDISELTRTLIGSSDFRQFCTVVNDMESVVSKAIGVPRVREDLFPDFEGSIKSLGAWGGDFILAASRWDGDRVREYFGNKGLNDVLTWNEMVFE